MNYKYSIWNLKQVYHIGDKRSRKTNRRLNSSDSPRDSWKMCGAGEDVGSYFDLLYEDLYTNHLTRSVLLVSANIIFKTKIQ